MTLVYAHRGSPSATGAGEVVRENTLDAFRAASDLGAHGVELDVRRTADGSLVLHHDVEIVDLAGSRRHVETAERSQLPLWLTSLDDALGLCGELGVRVNVEVKSETTGPSHDPAERCATDSALSCTALPGRAGTASAGRVVLSSFSLPALRAIRATSADLAVAWLFGAGTAAIVLAAAAGAPESDGTGDGSVKGGAGVADTFAELIADGLAGTGQLAELKSLRLEGLHPHDALAGDRLFEVADAHSLAVRPWTVDDPSRIATLAEAGATAVITNEVELALRATKSSR